MKSRSLGVLEQQQQQQQQQVVGGLRPNVGFWVTMWSTYNLAMGRNQKTQK
ncbi:MAG: hypothetical protein ACI8RD_000216 [Bacillariaceae sp.]|jgi:hypothetical protein